MTHAASAVSTFVRRAEDVWDAASKKSFAYDYASTLLVDRVTQPPLQFTAPELAGSVSDAPVTGKADVFSLACVMYQVLRGQPLITAETTSEYRSMLASMHLIPVDGLPPSLQARRLARVPLSQCSTCEQ
jgi:serine/threonine protein kinase